MMLVPSIDALKIGYSRIAAVAARSTKGRKVRLKPYWAWKLPLILSRILAIFVISTLWTVVTWAEVRLLNTMCSAIFWRMILMGSTRVEALNWIAGAAGCGGGGATFTTGCTAVCGGGGGAGW